VTLRERAVHWVIASPSAIAPDLKKSVLGFFVRKETPAQRPLLGVKPHLENAVLAAKDNGLVFVLVVSE
jgi:hypothetical protein